ncbi:hypothetical protein RSOL_128410, partial [Rhizoctonia solani AG-3 Rhs1AP]
MSDSEFYPDDVSEYEIDSSYESDWVQIAPGPHAPNASPSGQTMSEILSQRLPHFPLRLVGAQNAPCTNNAGATMPVVPNAPATTSQAPRNQGHGRTSAPTVVTLKSPPTQMITIRYEKNSSLPRHPTVFETVIVAHGSMTPLELRSLIIAKMGIFPMGADLACSILPSRPIKRLTWNSAEEVEQSLRDVVQANSRKKSVEKVLEITNVLPAPKVDGPATKKKTSDVIIEVTKDHQAVSDLKDKHYCAICPGSVCFIDPETGKHIRCRRGRHIKTEFKLKDSSPPPVASSSRVPPREYIKVESESEHSVYTISSGSDSDSKSKSNLKPKPDRSASSSDLPSPSNITQPRIANLLRALDNLHPELDVMSYAEQFHHRMDGHTRVDAPADG